MFLFDRDYWRDRTFCWQLQSREYPQTWKNLLSIIDTMEKAEHRLWRSARGKAGRKARESKKLET